MFVQVILRRDSSRSFLINRVERADCLASTEPSPEGAGAILRWQTGKRALASRKVSTLALTLRHCACRSIRMQLFNIPHATVASLSYQCTHV